MTPEHSKALDFTKKSSWQDRAAVANTWGRDSNDANFILAYNDFVKRIVKPAKNTQFLPTAFDNQLSVFDNS